ncbi:MAG: DUF3089 domain-containing protein [Burkholderiaceae bacterium]|jgi:hypothetical protein|nr:DUF3089 domain-containing protein [Burkholderiaceae bacterium]
MQWKQGRKYITTVIFGFLSLFTVHAAFAAPGAITPPTRLPDYAQGKNWVRLPGKADKPVDVFFIYPTVIETSDPYRSPDDPEMRAEAAKLLADHGGIFKSANLYAPYYHQLSLETFRALNTEEKLEAGIIGIPFQDCRKAFEEYLARHNQGRPIIFAAHSQGTMVMKDLLLWIKDAHPEVLKRTVAAYLIGWAVNDNYLKRLGMPFASGRDDTGVIISWSTEAPDAALNPFTMGTVKGALVINPVSWKRDASYAPKEESLGSRMRPEDPPAGDRPHFADARNNLERGTVVTTAPVSSGTIWPHGVLHHFDYDLFYYDFQQNVSDRIAAWLRHHKP